MAVGEVLLNGTQIGTTGDVAAPLSNLNDANEITDWFVDSGSAWAGMDAGVPCVLTRVRLSPFGGQADECLQATIEGDSVTTNFAARGFVQGNYFDVSPVTSPQTLTFNANNTAGNCLVLFLVLNGAAVSSIGSSAGNTYTLAQGPAGGSTMACYVAANCVGAAADTVTVNFTGSPSALSMRIVEYSGIVTTSPVNASANTSGTSKQASVSVTTTTADTIIVGAFIGPSGNGIAGTGFLLRVDYNITHKTGSLHFTSSVEDETTTSTGTYTPAFTWDTGTNGAWFCIAVALQYNAPPNVVATIVNRPLTGLLANEYLITGASSKRYWAFVSPAGIPGIVSDLDFIVQYTSGVIAAAVAPVVITKGRHFDLPTVIQLACITTDAVIHYTLDGTTPTSGSPAYSGPFTLNTSATLKAIAISTGLSNSRVTTAIFYIPATIVSTDALYDDRNQRILGINPQFLFDPVSMWWYMYAQQVDYAGVFFNGYIGQNVYKSADLRNWIFVAEVLGKPYGFEILSQTAFAYSNRVCVLYNAANNNYVLWTDTNNTSPNSPQQQVFTSPSPAGPFTLFASYTSFNSQSVLDVTTFADDNGAAWLMCSLPTGDLLMTKLNAAYTNVDGVNSAVLSKSAFGGLANGFDGAHMFKNNSVYFLFSNNQNGWVADTNLYWTATNPLGPWSSGANPFVPVQGGSPDFTTAYDTQANFAIQVPGRNMVCYGGDRYDTGLANNVSVSSTANFQAYRFILLPVTFPTSTTCSINWNPSWTFDGQFPTVSGAPLAPYDLRVSGSVFTWFNQEPGPVTAYLDFLSPAGVARSEPIGMGINITAYTSLFAYAPGNQYKLRLVNANGATIVGFPPPPSPPAPPTPLFGGPGYFIVLDIWGQYTVLNLKAGVDYSSNLQLIVPGGFGNNYSAAVQALVSGPYWPAV